MDNPSDVRFSELRSVSRSANLWNAIEELVRDTNHPQWSGFSSTALSHIPSGFEIPTEFQESLQYDSNLGVLTSFQRVTPEMQKRIVESAPDYAWFHDVEMARRQATQPTSLFIGGGGFIFPRWFLNEYPKSPRIEVAELDAAVYHATLAAFGMTVEEEKRISTWIGDARNFIDDRLTNNQWLRDKGREEVKYDFIYGDAFNDFGIPAHLTTVEFLKKVDELLNDNGIFMVNVIDIYPRTEIPGRRQEFGEVAYSGYLPSRLARKKWSAGIYREAGRLFAPLEILQQDDHKFRIRTRRKISIREEAWLANVNQFEPALK
ncbi:MAG: hypothetical protein FJ267_20220, partial [Planctomycetes bacterium]|nr:hypothetical protein [Planctomycetota bacterium]